MESGTIQRDCFREKNGLCSDLYRLDSVTIVEISERSARLEVKNFRIIPDENEPDDLQLTEALQQFLDLVCGDLPSGCTYALTVYHPAIPFRGGNIFVNYREHTGRESELVVNLFRTLIQSNTPLSFTDNINFEIAAYDTGN